MYIVVRVRALRGTVLPDFQYYVHGSRNVLLHYSSFLNRMNMTPGVLLGSELDRDFQNWAKILGVG